MSAPEFSRPVRLDSLGAAPNSLHLVADIAEREGLARRFGLVALDGLSAEVALVRSGDIVTLSGRVRATVQQACVATGRPVAATIDEPLALRFLPQAMIAAGDDVELGSDDCDVEGHDGRAVDAGEAVAATLLLALDPFPRAPGADAVLKAAGVVGEGDVGPFAGLAAMRDRLARDSDGPA